MGISWELTELTELTTSNCVFLWLIFLWLHHGHILRTWICIYIYMYTYMYSNNNNSINNNNSSNNNTMHVQPDIIYGLVRHPIFKQSLTAILSFSFPQDVGYTAFRATPALWNSLMFSGTRLKQHNLQLGVSNSFAFNGCQLRWLF